MFKLDYKVAESGEVFYVYKGKLCVAKNMEEYQMFIEKEERIRTTFFEIRNGTDYFKYNITSHKAIMNAINKIQDLNRKVNLIKEYFELKKEVLG